MVVESLESPTSVLVYLTLFVSLILTPLRHIKNEEAGSLKVKHAYSPCYTNGMELYSTNN